MESLSEETQKILEEAKIEVLPDDNSQYDIAFKVIVIGDSGVGKSCLTINAVKNVFSEGVNATVGFDFCNFCVKIDEKIIKLQIWDTSGTEIYRSLVVNFYRNSSLAFMVYSIDNKTSFDNINFWLKDVKNQSNPNVKLILIGSKKDLDNKREVPTLQAKRYGKDLGFSFFEETSSKTGENTRKVFIEAAKLLYGDYLDYQVKRSRSPSVISSHNKKLIPQPTENDLKKKCCL